MVHHFGWHCSVPAVRSDQIRNLAGTTYFQESLDLCYYCRCNYRVLPHQRNLGRGIYTRPYPPQHSHHNPPTHRTPQRIAFLRIHSQVYQDCPLYNQVYLLLHTDLLRRYHLFCFWLLPSCSQLDLCRWIRGLLLYILESHRTHRSSYFRWVWLRVVLV